MTAPILGTLAWRPAPDVPELLAPPVAELIARLGLEAYAAAINPSLADTAAFCAAYEVPLERSANCVVVSGRRGDQVTTAACLVLATDRADINKVIRRHLDVRKISFAPMEEAVSRTGMEYGGITPVGLPAGWPILVDSAVAAGDWLVVGSGIRGSKLAVSGATLGELPHAEVLTLRLSATG
ncbi:MAG TPA: YbaK/EbsC family protein [Propionibacteriaceae bacterium]